MHDSAGPRYALNSPWFVDSPLSLLLCNSWVLDKKVEREEGLLVALHGEAYESYREAVAKFVPRFY